MKARIMVIEDDVDNAKLIAWAMEDQGHHCESFGTAEEGLAVLQQRPFDLVLMDICLPGMDGKEATRAIRKIAQFTHLPVLAVTGHATKKEGQAIRDSGVTDLITKPVDEQHLIEMIASHLQEGRTHAQDPGC